MQNETPDWVTTAAEAGIRLETIAHFLGTPFHTVYAYTLGRRNPPIEWLNRVHDLIAHPEWVAAADGCYDKARAA